VDPFSFRGVLMVTQKMRATKRDVSAVIPKRDPDAHKGYYGKLLVIGGSSRFTGAPALVGMTALRSGVDLVTIAAPAEPAKVISSFLPDLIAIKLPCHDLEPSVLPELEEEFKRCTAVVVGPGLGTKEKTREAVVDLAQRLRSFNPSLPVLFDADGLKALAGERELCKGMPWVFTPHTREFEVLTGVDLVPDVAGHLEHVKTAAEWLGCTILLKAHVDVIASPSGDVKLNYTGNPGMTVGGSGDVLAGIVATFLAQGADPFRASVAGAWVCGRAGDLCRREKGYEFIASDVVEKIPDVFKEVRGSK
jgi:hydroxyethylthiazole kinase-like uncharacterized protein yjeF